MPVLQKETSIFPDDLFQVDFDSLDQRYWWVVQTKPRQEKTVARALLSRETPFFLPLIPKYYMIQGRKVRSFLPLFGGYVFIHATEEQRVAILKTNRIKKFLEVIDEQLLFDELRQIHCLIDSGVPLTVESRLQPGHRVRVKNGPFEGMEGTITRRKSNMRLQVAISFLQSAVSLEINDYRVEPI